MQSGDSGSQPATAGPGARCGHKPTDSVESLEDMRRFEQQADMHRCVFRAMHRRLQCSCWHQADVPLLIASVSNQPF
jgi:hypothetical protein